MLFAYFFFFKQKTAYEMRISDWSSDVCSSDLRRLVPSSSQLLSDIRQVERLQRALLKLTVFTGCSASQSDLIGFAHRNEHRRMRAEIGRASCRERVCQYV